MLTNVCVDDRAPYPVQECVDPVDAVAVAVVRARLLVAAARKPSTRPRIVFVEVVTTQSWTTATCRVEPRNFLVQFLHNLIIVPAARMARHGRCRVELPAAPGKSCPELAVPTPQAMKGSASAVAQHLSRAFMPIKEEERGAVHGGYWRRMAMEHLPTFPKRCHAWLATCTISVTTPPRKKTCAASRHFAKRQAGILRSTRTAPVAKASPVAMLYIVAVWLPAARPTCHR